MNRKNGYSLVEIMVSMVIFTIAVLPLTKFLTSITTDYRGKEYVIAASLLDRSYERIKTCPESLKRIERFNIDGNEWRVETSKSGDKPVHFKLSVYRGGNKIETAQFYR